MIRLENVIKIYGEDFEKKIALNNICLEIKDGEFVAVSVFHSLIFPDLSYILLALSPDCPVFNIDVTVFFLLI